MKIKNIKIDNGGLFAPMAGVSDVVYRSICARKGAVLTYSEMISALSISYNPDRHTELRMRSKDEKIAAIQLFGDNPKIMAKIAKDYTQDFDIIDINMGCPAPKVVKNNQGSALMKDINLASDIVKAMVDAQEKPVTVKIRKGFDEENINAVEFAKAMQDAGASAVCVHGRTRMQYYSGKADWDIIRQVKQELSIPVIGNGDIFNAQDAVDMKEYTKCDVVMVARGAQGNPFIFSQIAKAFNGEAYDNHIQIDDIIETIMEHAYGLEELFGTRNMSLRMRKHLCWYSKGIKQGAQLRKQAVNINDISDIIEFTNEMKRHIFI